MKIALIHYAAPPIVGGVETVIQRQALLLKNHGHQVKIAAGRGAETAEDIPVLINPLLDSRTREIISIKEKLDKGIVPDEFENLKDRILKYMEEVLKDDEVLIAHNVASLHKNLALTAALNQFGEKHPEKKLILWHHDMAWQSARYEGELYAGYPWDLLRQAWPGAVQVTISEARRASIAELMKIAQDEISVIPAGMEIMEFFHMQAETREILEKTGLLNHYPILLTPVRITRRKNIETAIKTLHVLKKDHPQTALIVTGPPGAHNPDNINYFNELRNLRDELGLQKQVYLLAEFKPYGLSSDAIPDYFQLADVLMMPSFEEGFGIPLLEAGLSRMPVFCSDIEQLKALGGEHATYFKVDEDPQVIAALINSWLKQDRIYQYRVSVRKNFTWGAVYRNRIKPLLEII